VLSVFMQFEQFCIRTYVTKVCESLQPAASGGHLKFRMHQIRFAPGLCPGPRWGSSRRSSRPPSWMGRGIPSPYTLPGLSACWFAPNLFFVPARLAVNIYNLHYNLPKLNERIILKVQLI